MQKIEDKLIGFIGQGWIGKHYADDFEKRGFSVVRYALEEPYYSNKDKIKDCDIVFIAVPTPSTPEGFDDSIVREAVKLAGEGKTVVIKSTMLPGVTEAIQAENPDKYITHSPEFLREATAAYDAANPDRNIIGVPEKSEEFLRRAEEILSVLPEAPHKDVCHSKEAELIKYAGNCYLYLKVIYANMLHDLATELGCEWDKIKHNMIGDPRIGKSHLDPVHDSGRGAGGHCFIKDFSAFTEMYEKLIGDELGLKVLEAIKDKNIDYLVKSGKSLDLLKGVYGEDVIK
jgi:nucleotide sugar dehydrogenase